MQVERPSLSSSPSLSAYVHDHPSVVRSCSHCSDEPTTRSESDSDHKYQHQQQGRREGEQEAAENENESNNSGGGFEFSFDCAEAMSSPISAYQIFHNGRIKLTMPMYEVARVYPEQEDRKSTGGAVDDPRLKVAVEKMIQKTSRRKALRRLFKEEKEKYSSASSISISTSASASTSSSETDEATENASISELESVPPSDTYCVWKPKTSSDSNPKEISKKSEPLSKRWKLKDLLTRNTSEKVSQSHTQTQSSINNSNKNEKEVRAAPQLARKMAMKGGGGERRKSYLPYRQELVGIFGSNGSGSNLQRF